MTTLRAAILAADDLKRKAVEVKEWGVTVYVQHVDGFGRALIEKAFAQRDPNDAARLMATVVTIGLVDERGARVFTDADVDALLKKNFDVVRRLYDSVMEFNGASADAMEKTEGNSGGVG
jgi:hypothetical protein